LCEYAYSVGDDAFDEIVAIAKFFVDNPDVILTNSEQLLRDFHEAYTENKHEFISSHDLCEYCKEAGSIWKYYGKGGLTPEHLPILLKGYKIKSTRDTKGQQRGFYANQFGEAWKRVLKLDIPDGLDGIDTLSRYPHPSCNTDTPLAPPHPFCKTPQRRQARQTIVPLLCLPQLRHLPHNPRQKEYPLL